MELLLVPGTAASGLSALGGHRYTAAGVCASPVSIQSSPKLTTVLEASLFVIGAGFGSLSWQVKTLLSTLVSFPSWGVIRLNSFKPRKSQPSRFSTRKMWIAKLHPLGSLSQQALQHIAISYWPEFMYFHVTHLFTGTNQRECLLHHPLGISGI